MAATQKAVVIVGPNEAKLVTDRPIPKLRDGFLLIKTKAVALNPTDWKHVKGFAKGTGLLVGCDYAGVVEEVGPGVTKEFKKGDRICGVTHGSNAVQPEDGAFAEYIVAKADVQMKIPDYLSFEDAATLGVGIVTVTQGLYHRMGLEWPTSPIKDQNTTILIYGGSTATGVLGIQFAKLSGYKVITTCSKHNFDLVKSLGADEVFDYRDPDCAKKIREYTNDNLTLAWDTISLPSSAQLIADSLTTKPDAKYNALLTLKFPREDVNATYTLAYSTIGEAFKMGDHSFPASPEDSGFAKKFIAEVVQPLLDAGKFKVHKPRVGDGLEGVLDGLKDLEEDKVSGEKLVYTVRE